MLIKFLFIAALASSAISRNVPRYAELDDEDQELFRAAYDAPYEQEEYHEEIEVPGKLDLLKGGIWALKTKMQELKVFDKALAAHLLDTKLKLKKLLSTMKKPLVVEVETKPVYHYQSPAPSYHPYEPPHYSAPAPPVHYGPHAPQYSPPQQAPPKYEPPKYEPPKYEPPKYEPPKYEPPKYDPPAHPQYPQVQYEAQHYVAPPLAQQHGHDPYYGY